MKRERIISVIIATVIALSSLCLPVFAEAGEDIVSESIILFKGMPKSLVNGVETAIDPDNSAVVPPVVKNRTFVPLRFIAENLGAEVDYDGEEKKVSISSEGTDISVIIGSGEMTVNGSAAALDSEAFIREGRTFIPLRAISEAFGKKVFYDERGIIIISDRQVDEEADRAALDGLAKSFGPVGQAEGGFDENGVREVDIHKYEYNQEAHSKHFAHGVLRGDEGTMEMTFNPLRPMSEMGNNYDFAMGVLTSQVTAGLTINIFSVHCNPKPDKGLIFLYKSKTSSQYLKVEDFDWEAGERFNVAFTWKAGDKMCMYKDGVLVGSMDMGDGITEDILPYNFRIDRTTAYNVRKMKFSTRAKSAEELDMNSDSEFDIDEDTAFVTSEGCENPRYFVTNWHKETGYSAMTPIWKPAAQMYFEGEEVVYPVVAVNHSGEPKNYTVKFGVKDDYGIDIGSSEAKITVPADDQYHVYDISLPQINAADYYLVRSDIYDGDEWLYGYDNAISVCNKFDDVPYGKMKDIFGLQIGLGEDFDMTKVMGIDMLRAMQEFRWSRLEQTKGNFDFRIPDLFADAANERGLDTLAVLGYPPAWASLEPSAEKRAQGKKFSALPERWQPRDKEEWANYIRTTVSHFKGRIKYWEIYNEINFIFPFSAQTFSGTKEEYYELLHIAYQEAKKADPDCVIVLSGFSAPHVGAVDVNMPMEMIDDRFKEGYYDIFNDHGYLGEASFAKEIEALKAKWPNKEYWMGEYMSYTLEGYVNRAVEFIKTISDFAAAGYSKVVSMGVEGSDPVLNLNATKSPTVSFQAMAVMSEILRRCDESAGKTPKFSKSDSMRIDHVFKRSDGKYVTMLSAYPTEYMLTISNPDAEIYTMYGTKAETEKSGAATKVLLSDVLYIISDEPAKITSATGASSDNLLKNGKFEDVTGDTALGIESLSIDGWTVNASGDSKIYPSEDKRSGKYAVRMDNSGNGKTFLSQKVDRTVPTEFKVTARVKKPDAKSKVVPYVSMINNDTGKEVVRKISGADTGEYIEVNERLALPMKSEKGVTFCFGAMGAEGSVLFDDVQVVEAAEGMEGVHNLISNGGFEEGDGGWRKVTSSDPEGSVSVYPVANSGEKSMYFKSTGAGSIYAVQDVVVDKPGTYKITCFCKRLSGRTVVPYFRIYDRNANKGGIVTITNLLTYKFVENTATLNVDNPNGTQIAAIFGINAGEGEVLFDDILVEKLD